MDATVIAVLLVDDHRVFTDTLAIALAAQPGLRCSGVAHSVPDALALAGEVAFQVAVVDLRLPGGGGLGLVAQLRRRQPPAKVLVLTAHPRPDLAQRALAAGAGGFLGKDAPLADILAAVRALAAGEEVGAVGVAPPPGDVRVTGRELEVLAGLGRGLDAGRIAAELGISVHTTRDHIRALLGKLDVHTQLDAVVTAERLGLITVGTGF